MGLLSLPPRLYVTDLYQVFCRSADGDHMLNRNFFGFQIKHNMDRDLVLPFQELGGKLPLSQA